MNINRITQILIGFVLFVSIFNYEIFTLLIRTFGSNGFFHPAMLSTNLLSIFFILCPLLALYYYLKNNNLSYLWLSLFSIPAFTFGVAAIPFAAYFYSSNIQLNTIFIITTNIALIIASWYLYRAKNV